MGRMLRIQEIENPKFLCTPTQTIHLTHFEFKKKTTQNIENTENNSLTD